MTHAWKLPVLAAALCTLAVGCAPLGVRVGRASRRAYGLFGAGVALELAGQREKAIAYYRRAARHFPRSPRVRGRLGLALEAAGRQQAAVKHLLAAARYGSQDVGVLTAAARYYNGQGRTGEAARLFERALETLVQTDIKGTHRPRILHLYRLLAEHYRRAGDRDRLVWAHREMVRIEPKSVELRAALAQALFETSWLEGGAITAGGAATGRAAGRAEAAEILAEARASTPASAEAALAELEDRLRRGRFTRAWIGLSREIARLEALPEDHGSKRAGRQAAARLLVERGRLAAWCLDRPGQAAEDLAGALEILVPFARESGPRSMWARTLVARAGLDLARLLAETERATEALEVMRSVQTHGAPLPELFVLHAALAERPGSGNEAETLAGMSVHPVIALFHGRALRAAGRTGAAIQILRRALAGIEQKSGEPPLARGRGPKVTDPSLRDRASRQGFDRAAHTYKTGTGALSGRDRRNLGQLAAELAETIAPDEAPQRGSRRRSARARRRQLAEARAIVRSALARSPQDRELVAAEARIQFLGGQASAAERRLVRLVQRRRPTARAWEYLGDCRLARGAKGQAARCYRLSALAAPSRLHVRIKLRRLLRPSGAPPAVPFARTDAHAQESQTR